MQIENNPNTITFNERVVRIKTANIEFPKALLVMLHGWTGDETSTWVLTSHLKDSFTILAPRGTFTIPHGGYAWADITLPKEQLWAAYQKAAATFHTWLQEYIFVQNMQSIPIYLTGFSQGAMMVYSLMLLYPGQYQLAACIAGALISEAESLITPDRVKNVQFYIAHGSLDRIIPIKQARRAARLLEEAGAVVTYCESPTGHKASAECHANLAQFLNGTGD